MQNVQIDDLSILPKKVKKKEKLPYGESPVLVWEFEIFQWCAKEMRQKIKDGVGSNGVSMVMLYNQTIQYYTLQFFRAYICVALGDI